MSDKPTEHMTEFLKELAELFDRHGIKGEAVDNDADYYPLVDGVELDQSGDLFSDVRYCSVRLPRYFDADDIRKLIEL